MGEVYGVGFDSVTPRGRTSYGKSERLAVGDGGVGCSLQVKLDEGNQYTVQIDLDTSGVAAGTVVEALVSVSWRCEGQTVLRLYDIAAGLSISGNGEAVSVDVTDKSPAKTGDTYKATITVARFARPTSPVPPVRTGFSGSIGAASSHAVPVPPGANGLAIFGSQFAGFYIQEFANSGFGATLVLESDVTIGQWIPLVQGARVIVLNNPSASPVTGTVIFSIDG